MIDYLAKAKRYINERVGDHVSVLEESIVDTDRFYCFTFQSNEFIKTENFSTMLVGHGYTIINKEDGRFFDFGSRHSLDQSLKILDENLRTEQRIRKHKFQFELGTKYDLQINVIRKHQVLVEKLKEQEVTYIIPEVVSDSIFRIAKRYDSKSLEKRLMDLPVVFHGIADSLTLIDELLTSDCCDFDLLRHEERTLAKYIGKATDEDLRPIW
jgi:hypothetical protein